MEPDQIKSAKDRAQSVIDGVARVKDQQARDVVKLSDHIEQQNKVIDRLDKKVRELNAKILMHKATGGRYDSNIFGL